MIESEMTGGGFVPIGKYASPSPPAQHALRRWLQRLKNRFGEDDPVRSTDRLCHASEDVLDDLVGPPSCGPMVEYLQRTLAAWIQDAEPESHIQVVVLPPCERVDVLGA